MLDSSERDAIIVVGMDTATAGNVDLATDPEVGQSVYTADAHLGTTTPGPVRHWLQGNPAQTPLLVKLQTIAVKHSEPEVAGMPHGCGWSATG